MTQEDKELLLKDICARLPHDVKVAYINPHVTSDAIIIPLTGINLWDENISGTYGEFTWELEYIKPYLRPMSSMTKEEYDSINWEKCSHAYSISKLRGFTLLSIKSFTLEVLDWLNANYLDYRGLIEKGLAIEAPKGMYKID